MEGRLNGFYKDVVLLEQPSVAEVQEDRNAAADEAGVTITGFARYEVGQH